MRKTLLKILVLYMAICSMLFVFTACGESPISFKLNFIVDNEIVKTIDTTGNERISLPNDPQKDGYTFDGWFWDKDVWEKSFTANSLLDAPLSSDMSVYAKFTKNHEHNYAATVTAPTCTEKGYTTYTCECGDSYKSDYVDELGHNYNAVAVVTEPTCTEQGYTTHTCSRCKDCYIDTYINELEHEFTNYVSDNNATYDSDGTKTAHCNHGCGATDTTTDAGTKLQSGIVFKTLSVDKDLNVYGKVPNTQATFSFINEVEVKGNATFVVSTDIYGMQQIPTKTVPIEIGDNTFYITETVGNNIKLFTVTVRRRPIYTVSFNTNGGTTVVSQQVEEDSPAIEPTTTKAGYTFIEWDYNFDNPITNNTVITAGWTANTDAKYKVEYYLQNLEDDNYTLHETDNLTGTTDTTANADIKEYEHFTHTTISQSKESENINGDGTAVLKVYYTRDGYNFTVQSENTKGGTINCTENGTYKYETVISLLATVNAGYDFVGWFNGETQISNELGYSFTLTEKTDITAKYYAHKNTKYTVEIYFENLDGTFTKQNTEENFGETDTTVTITPALPPEHYTLNSGKSVLNGNINGDSSLLLKIYYTLERFTINISANKGISLNNSYKTNYKYGETIQQITANVLLGYDWQGWYSDGEFMTGDFIIPSFTVDRNINYVATCNVKSEMSNFNFSLYENTCQITGIIDTTVTEIYLPNYVNGITKEAFGDCKYLTTINVSDENKYFTSIDGNLYSKDGKTLVKYAIGKRESDYTVNEGVTKIAEGAFYNCTSLKALTMPDSVVFIGAFALYGCNSLESLTIPFVGASRNVTYERQTSQSGGSPYLFGYIFGSCFTYSKPLSYLTSHGQLTYKGGQYTYQWYDNYYYIPTMLKTVAITSATGISAYAFAYCDNITQMILPETLTKIGDNAFYGCSGLTEIVIPDNVMDIGREAFAGCSTRTEYSLFPGGTILYRYNGLEKITIGSGVRNIGRDAFSSLALTSLVFKTTTGWYYIDAEKQYSIGNNFNDPSAAASYYLNNFNIKDANWCPALYR